MAKPQVDKVTPGTGYQKSALLPAYGPRAGYGVVGGGFGAVGAGYGAPGLTQVRISILYILFVRICIDFIRYLHACKL